eukprot:gene32522-40134_t
MRDLVDDSAVVVTWGLEVAARRHRDFVARRIVEGSIDQSALGSSGQHDVARAYVLYRAKHMEERRAKKDAAGTSAAAEPELSVTENGVRRPLVMQEVRDLINAACSGLEKHVDADAILAETVKNLYDGVPVEELHKSAILAARALMEKDPAYSQVTARILLHTIRKEVFGHEVPQAKAAAEYITYFPQYIAKGIENELLDAELAKFDLAKLAKALVADRDLQFGYIGLQTLYDRYFLHVREVRIEMPQAFYMRVAMGLSLREENREARAIEFYNLLSTFDFMSSTPTLFNSGTLRSQLSSCYLTTVSDDLEGIYDAIKENALLAKFAGGLGNDWTPVRALGAHIKGTNGKSQGVVPFLKVVNDTAVAVNQGGKRKGAVCAYLETWHMDIEEFLDLRKNTGDDRRRTHDMNTANWIPDLFMKRVMEKGDWTLFSPSETPDLHDKVGKAFELAYTGYEAKAAAGEIRVFKKIAALDLWRKMLAGGDPFDPRGAYVAVPSQAVPLQSGQMPAVGWVDGRTAVPSGHAAMGSAYAAVPAVAADAMEDIAQLERLVNRLSGGSQAAPLSAWRAPTQMGQPIYTVPFVAPTESPVVAADVVGGMMVALAQDTRLLPAVQRAVQNLEPALKQLVRFDPRFFSDAGHPARRLLDEMTQRSLAFASEEAPGFAQFVRLINEAVAHLAASQIKDATPFETVLKALYSAWDTQEQRAKAKEAAQKKVLQRAEQRAMLAEKIAADIRRLPDMGQVPSDVLDFAAGPWADVVALAQVSQVNGAEDDPGGYLALVPMLLWSAQPELTRLELDRLTQAIPDMLAKLREGLRTVDYPAAKTSTFIERLVALHQSAFEMPMPSGTSIPLPQGEVFAEPPDSLGSEMPSEDSLQAVLDTGSGSASDAAADPFANFVVGAWVELITNQRPVRTQLTWASPNGTLFLFTSPDGSPQCSSATTAHDKPAASQPMPGKCAALARSMAGLYPTQSASRPVTGMRVKNCTASR